jgi:spectinomycin phosphotransferase
VKAPQAGIEEHEIVAALADHWGLSTIQLRYLAVGFDDHHWAATEATGRRRFVTVRMDRRARSVGTLGPVSQSASR